MAQKLKIESSYEEVAHQENTMLEQLKEIQQYHPDYEVTVGGSIVRISGAIEALEKSTATAQEIIEHFMVQG